MASQALSFRSMGPRHSSWDSSAGSSFYSHNTYPTNTTEGIVHTRSSSWPREFQTHEDKALPLVPQTHYRAMLQADSSNFSKLYRPYRVFSPYTLAESLSSNTRHTWHVQSNASRASSPQLHLTDFSKYATAPQINIYKALPPIKISQHTSPKQIPPQEPTSASSGPILLPVLLTIETPTSATPVSPGTSQTSISAPLSPPLAPAPPSPKPKYGDERFHTLPEEAYSWIDIPRQTSTKDDNDSNEWLNTHLARKASAVKEQERPFWRAAIEPTIDPRSGMNYCEQRMRRLRVG